MEPDVHHLDAEQAVASLGPIVIRVITRARTEFADVDRVATLIDRTLERSPIAGVWVVVHHGAPVPDLSVGRYASRALRKYGDRVCIAYSLLGLGFWAAAAIAAASSLSELMGTPGPTESTIERGAERLCMELVGVDPTRLIAAHDLLLERIQAIARRDEPCR